MARSLRADPRIGTELAGYRIEALLGRGGMSVVYLAEDLALGRKVALKLMAPELAEDRRFRERFRRESRLAASLDHPNVIPIYEAGEADGLLYIAMRYVEGTDLRSLLVCEGPLEPGRALALLSQVGEALDAAHVRGLIHRDVKPSNVLIAGEGEREHVYLADFGLTKTAATAGEGAESVQLSGTADYVAPEQITVGTADAGSDLYSLGCVLYECLTGRVPFPRESEFAVLWAHVDEPSTPPSNVRPELPHPLDAVIARALAKEPGERYESARELVEAARAEFPSSGRPGRRRFGLAGGIAALALTAALAPVLVLTRGAEESTTAPTLDLDTGALQRVDPEANELVATIKLGGEPSDVVVGPGGVWVVDRRERTISRIDPATDALVGSTSAPGTPVGIAAGSSALWVAGDGPQGWVVAQVDPERVSTVSDFAARDLLGPDNPLSLAVSAVDDVAMAESRVTESDVGAALWISDQAAGTLSRVRPLQGLRVPVDTVTRPLALTAVGDELWVAQAGDAGLSGGGVVHLDLASNVLGSFPLPFTSSALALDRQGVWVAERERSLVWLLDPETRARTPIAVGGRVVDLAAGAGAIWALSREEGKLWRIDPAVRKVVAGIEVGANATAVAAGEAAVWVAVGGGAPASLATVPRRYVFGLNLLGIEPGGSRAHCAVGLPVRNCVLRISGERIEANPPARVNFAIRERRVAGGSVRCGGKIYDGPVTSDVRGAAGLGRIDIDGWGTVALMLDRVLGAYSSTVLDLAGDPICQELHGTWTGVSGALEGESGRFSKVIPGELVLE